MIEIKNLTKKYGDSTVVNNLSFTVDDGSITGFIGPNGSGKTTTLKMTTGVLTPTEGTVLLNGIDISKHSIKAKQQFGFVSDSPDHFLRLTGLEYVNFMADMYDVPSEGRGKFILNYAERFDIATSLNSKILAYSHGMRQKIMIIGCLIHNPSIWILDEPMLGLDPQSAFELKNMMKEHVKKGNSVLFSTHVLEVAEKLCDKVVIIQKGNLKYNGTVEELCAQNTGSSLEEIFLKLTGRNTNE